MISLGGVSLATLVLLDVGLVLIVKMPGQVAGGADADDENQTLNFARSRIRYLGTPPPIHVPVSHFGSRPCGLRSNTRLAGCYAMITNLQDALPPGRPEPTIYDIDELPQSLGRRMG